MHAALGYCLEEIEFDQATMRNHLLKCFTTRNFTPFPTKKVRIACHTRIMNIDVFCSLTPMGIWCSVVFVNSGFTSSVLASTLFHQVQNLRMELFTLYINLGALPLLSIYIQ